MKITHYLIPNGISKTVQANPQKPLINDWFAYIRKEVSEARMRRQWLRINKDNPAYMSADLESYLHWRKWEVRNK